MEEEDQEVIKHVCKFCNKGFPCGRSLGGHMRSHVTNVSAESNEKFVAVASTTTMKKLSSSSLSGEGTTGSENGAVGSVGYGLRENPKKTWRLTDSGEETSLVVVLDKLCKECGKGFQSWKALFGHMKCHSDKERVSKFNSNSSLDDQDSCSQKKVVLDSKSDTEATVPNRRRRSKRRRTRYMMTPLVTSSVSFVGNCAPSCSSVSEAEQEQEEVALTLMMLSRDVSNWGGLNSIDDDNSLHFEAPLTDPVSKIEGKRVISNCSKIVKLAKSSDKKCEFENSKGKSSELLITESPKNDGFRLNKTRVSIIENGKDKKAEVDSEPAFEVNIAELVVSKSISKYTSIKGKFFDSEKNSSSLKTWVNKASEGEFSKKSHKRGKFECTTCKRIFHSYQALGGHRASHKRNKGCHASRNESSENTTELEEADTTIESSKLMKNTDHNEYVKEEHELEAVKSETVVLEESVPEIRNFLDLNLPAAAEEESNSHLAEPYKPWWIVGSNHKQEAIVGLLSN